MPPSLIVKSDGIEFKGSNKCIGCQEGGSLQHRIKNNLLCDNSYNFERIIPSLKSKVIPIQPNFLLEQLLENRVKKRISVGVPRTDLNGIPKKDKTGHDITDYICLNIEFDIINGEITDRGAYSTCKSIQTHFRGYDNEPHSHDLRMGFLSGYLGKFIWEKINLSNKSEYKILQKEFRGAIDKSVNEYHTNYFNQLVFAGLLHDIGKIFVPWNILHAPRKLSKEEFQIVTKHAEYGARLLKNIPGLEFAYSAAGNHHWRSDGTGYGLDLKGESIPLGAKIIMLGDLNDAMTNDRPYRKAIEQDEFLGMLTGEYKDQWGQDFQGHIDPIIQEIVLDYRDEFKDITMRSKTDECINFSYFK
ncbi:MAG: HD domain-containing protein [Candidatus Woesearchaeota archaeon]|jgi:hypothetical protein|nr:HD domain-containing protein [Candidatus Woesearchaeota archaeon]